MVVLMVMCMVEPTLTCSPPSSTSSTSTCTRGFNSLRSIFDGGFETRGGISMMMMVKVMAMITTMVMMVR